MQNAVRQTTQGACCMNFLQNPLVQYIIPNLISLVSTILTLISLAYTIAGFRRTAPRKEKTATASPQANAPTSRVRTRRGCLIGSAELFAGLAGSFYFFFFLDVATQIRLFPDSPIFITIYSIGLVSCLVLAVLGLFRLIRGEYQPTPELMQELPQPVQGHNEGNEG